MAYVQEDRLGGRQSFASRVLSGVNTPQYAPSDDQDPIYDHANGVKPAAFTASTIIFTPPTGCKYARIDSSVDIAVRVDNPGTVVDDGKAVIIRANVPETIPVTEAVPVKALSLGAAATVRILPLKVR